MEKLSKIEEKKIREQEVRAKKASLAEQGTVDENQGTED